MNQYTIQVSDKVYQLLRERATIENTTPEKVADHLLIQELAPSSISESAGDSTAVQEKDRVQALAAVRHLTTLFADVEINELQKVLEDPMLELANTDLIPDLS